MTDEEAAKAYAQKPWVVPPSGSCRPITDSDVFSDASIKGHAFLAGCAKVRAELGPESIDSPECRRALCVWNCQQRARAEALGGRLLEENEALREALWAVSAVNGRVQLSNVDKVATAHRIAKEVLAKFPEKVPSQIVASQEGK